MFGVCVRSIVSDRALCLVLASGRPGVADGVLGVVVVVVVAVA